MAKYRTSFSEYETERSRMIRLARRISEYENVTNNPCFEITLEDSIGILGLGSEKERKNKERSEALKHRFI